MVVSWTIFFEGRRKILIVFLQIISITHSIFFEFLGHERNGLVFFGDLIFEEFDLSMLHVHLLLCIVNKITLELISVQR